MSTAVAAQSSGSQSKRLSRELDRRPSRSSPRTQHTAITYGPIGGTTKPAQPLLGRSPGSPRSQNEDERAASALQQLTAGQYGKIGSPRDTHTSRTKATTTDASPASVPKIKTERPPSPEVQRSQATRDRQHRPRRLDLTNEMPSARTQSNNGHNAADRPLTSREAGSLSAMQDVGLLCLSPGFQTQDPAKQQQLAKSMEMREQQRQLIESRLHQQATSKDTENDKVRTNGDSPAAATNSNNNTFSKPPPSAKRKGPPPGLSINAPAPHQFASEPRVIQSAPINQSFTGLKPAPAHEHPLSRQVLQHTHHHNQYHGVAGTNGAPQFAPIGNHPPNSAGQRLPPISDVIASQDLGISHLPSNPYTDRDHRTLYAPHSNIAPLHSPGYPPPHPSAGLHPPLSAHFSSSRSRERDFSSADDAVQSLSGGREDLLPKIIHYGGGHQAPPSSSPHHGANGHSAAAAASSSSQPQYAPITAAPTSFSNGNSTSRPDPAPRTVSGTNRRRNRDEYEADMPNAADAMDVDGGPRGRVSAHARQRARMEDREDRERGAAAYFDEAMRGGMRDREEVRAVGERERDASWEERQKRKREEFLGICAKAWDLLHAD